MAHISEFTVGDAVRWDHKGSVGEGVIVKINRKSVKVDQTNSMTFVKGGGWGRPKYTRTTEAGANWTMHVADDGRVTFRHAEAALAAKSNGAAMNDVVEAVRDALRTGCLPETVLMAVASICAAATGTVDRGTTEGETY